MKIYTFSLIAALALSAFTHFTAAAASAASAVQDPACRQDLADPADVGFRLSDESLMFKGQCVDGRRFRPILNFSENEAAAQFDNYQHANRYWNATVPLKAENIAKVYFHVLKFPVVEGVVAAHTQIRFVFKPEIPVRLKAYDGTLSTHSDILISFEAGFPVDVKYNFALGAFNNYALLAKIMSSEQKHNDSGSPLEQFELLLTPKEQATLLKSLLSYSAQLGQKDFYNTLRPNCTTEVFDRIDELPRFKGKHAPFLTMISPDPIAGPSIKALVKRGLIKEQAQDFAEELKGVYLTKPLPEPQDPLSNFLPQVPGQPWSLVTVLPDEASLSESEKAALATLRQKMILAIPSLIQSYGSVMLLANKEEQGQKLFLNTLKEFVSRLPETLRQINSELPEKPVFLRIYFAPHKTDRTSTELVELGIPAEIPFALIDYRSDARPDSTRKILERVGDGVRVAGQTGLKTQPAFLMGAAILVRAQRDHSQVTTQLIGGLNPVVSPMSTVDPKVTIDRVVIPDTAHWGRQHPGMVITHVQDVNEEAVNPRVDVKFGPFDHLDRPNGPFGEGAFGVTKYFNMCEQRNRYTPVFQGRINTPVLGNPIADYMLGIQFYVVGLGLDLKTRQVEKMDLAISLLTLNCFEDWEEVETQFAGQANQALQDMLTKATDDPIFRMLAPLFN